MTDIAKQRILTILERSSHIPQFWRPLSITGNYEQVEFLSGFVPPWLAFRIDSKGTGNGREFMFTRDGSSYETGVFTITEVDGASEQ